MADVQIDQDAANIPAVNVVDQVSDPSAPGTGHVLLYVKAGVLYVRLSDGTVASVGGAVTLPEGRLAIGDGDDLLSALALGSEGDVVTADASGFATWASPAAPGGGDMVRIATHTTAAGGEASYTFSTIAGTYSHLRLLVLGRVDANTTNYNILMQFNGDTGNNYKYQLHQTYSTTNSAAGSGASAVGYGYVGNLAAATSPSGGSGAITIDIVGYANTTWHKQALSRWVDYEADNATGVRQGSAGTVWRNTAAITSVTLLTGDATKFLEGTVFTLYGVN